LRFSQDFSAISCSLVTFSFSIAINRRTHPSTDFGGTSLPEEIIEMVDSIIHISFLKENIMSTAEMLIGKGKQEGRQEEIEAL
jgi:hypothetical protein